MKEDGNGRVHIEGMTEILVGSYEEFMYLLSMGEANRQKRNTALNECSSRSHTLVEVSLVDADGCPKMTLVDLAGSERFTADQLRDKGHQIENRSINQSLTHLGRYPMVT